MPTVQLRDVGELQHVHAMSTEARTTRGMKTICATCGEPVTEEYFYAGFAHGQPTAYSTLIA